jgi:hypothetical protein
MTGTQFGSARRLTTAAVFVLAIVGFACSSFYFPRPHRGEALDRWETSNNTLKVRVTEYSEKGRTLPGAYYVFESTAVGSDEWHEIMTLRHDDQVPIPREQVRLQTDAFGYVFMVYKYAVTTDGGTTWSLWDAIQDIPDWQHNRAVIKEIQIATDGIGTMTLTPYTYRGTPELHTKDYGRHWSSD